MSSDIIDGLIDYENGVEKDEEPKSRGLQLFFSTGDMDALPLHLRNMPRATGSSLQEMLDCQNMVSSYTQAIPKPLKAYVGRVVHVCGAIIFETPPMRVKSDPNGPLRQFFQARLKLESKESVEYIDGKEIKEIQQNIVLVSYGKYIFDLVGGLISALGWYDWDVTVPMLIMVAPDSGAITARIVG